MLKEITDVELCKFLDRFLRVKKPEFMPSDVTITFLEPNPKFLSARGFRTSFEGMTNVILINVQGNTFPKGYIITDNEMIIKRIKTFSSKDEIKAEGCSFAEGYIDSISTLNPNPRHNTYLEQNFLNHKLKITDTTLFH